MTYAETPSVTAEKVTCQELKDLLANDKTLKVYYRVFGIRTYNEIHESITCGEWERKVDGVFWTKDIPRCHVGLHCTRIRIP